LNQAGFSLAGLSHFHLGDAQASGVDSHEQGSVLESAGGGKELSHFRLAEDDGEPLGLFLTDDTVEVPVASEGDAGEENQGAADLVEQAEGNLLADEVDEEVANLFQIEPIRG
jgi:hypothetical protein